MKPVCANCCQIMNIKKIGATFVEYDDKQPSEPIRLWSCDLYVCPTCSSEILTSFGSAPISHRDKKDFNSTLSIYRGLGPVLPIIKDYAKVLIEEGRPELSIK